MHIFPDVRSQRFSLGFVLALLMAATFLASSMMAQRLDGTLRGDIKDQTGAMVPEAKVTATNEATNVPQTMNTGDSQNGDPYLTHVLIRTPQAISATGKVK